MEAMSNGLGRPTNETIRARLLYQLEQAGDRGIPVLETRFTPNSAPGHRDARPEHVPKVNGAELRILESLLDEQLIEAFDERTSSLVIGRDGDGSMRRVRLRRESDPDDLSYDRFSDPRPPRTTVVERTR